MSIVGIAVGLVLLWGLITGWHRYFALWLIRSAPVQSGSLYASASGPGLIWRQEVVLRASLTGPVELLVADGTFVEGEQPVARVGGQLVIARRAGQVWFSVDGWEREGTAAVWAADAQAEKAAAQAAHERSTFTRRPIHAGQTVRGGQEIGVLIDPFQLQVVVWLPAAAKHWLPRPGRGSIEVEWVGGRENGQVANVVPVEGQADRIGVVVALDGWPQDLALRRFSPVTLRRLLSWDTSLIPWSALWVQQGQLGVFALPAHGGRRPVWIPVDIQGIWSPEDQVGVTVWEGRLYAGGLGSGLGEWPGPGLPPPKGTHQGPYHWTALTERPASVQVAVAGVPPTTRVVTNPGWVASWKLYL